MIAFSMRKLPNESIVFCTVHRGWQTRRDLGSLVTELFDLLQRVKYPTYLIIDLRETVLQPDDVLLIAGTTTRGQYAILNHINLRTLILISTDPLISLLAMEMLSRAKAYALVLTYPNQKESLEMARGLIHATRNEREAFL